MDSDFGTPTLGTSHHFAETNVSFERLRYIKTPQQANAKWVASTSTGEATWADNLQRTTKPIVQSAIDARPKMQQRFNEATQPGGRWETRLQAVGDAGIKAAANAKRGNYSQGVQQGSAKQLAAITKILAYEAQALGQLSPKSGAGSGRTRMNEWYDLMSAARGTLGA
jgi:hypothetical protein